MPPSRFTAPPPPPDNYCTVPIVTDNIFRAVDGRQITAMVLIDLSKAFDSLCHSTLLTKLQLLGTSEKALPGSRVTCQTDSSVLELEHHCRIP